MKIGVSTACMYPMETERSFAALNQSGFRLFEIFFNSYCELQGPILQEIRRTAASYGSRVVSIHPFTSGYEPFLLFSNYQRRFEDGLELYKRYFETANALNAGIVVIHGLKEKQDGIGLEEYCRRFRLLKEAGARAGVLVAQENVNGYVSARAETLREMRRLIPDVSFVFDPKQAVRAGQDPFEILSVMGGNLCHVHLNDHDGQNTCLLPGQGGFDFDRMFRCLWDSGYHGEFVLELYRQNFSRQAQLWDGAQTLDALYQKNQGKGADV